MHDKYCKFCVLYMFFIYLGGVNEFIDPPEVTGLLVLPDERLELVHCILNRIAAFQRPGTEKMGNVPQEQLD